MTRRPVTISDLEWDAIRHLPGTWHDVSGSLVRVYWSRQQRGYVAVTYGRPEPVSLLRYGKPWRVRLGPGSTVIGIHETIEQAVAAGKIVLELRDVPRLTTVGDIVRYGLRHRREGRVA